MGAVQFKYLYGPVYSWRMGMSLGIDPISTAHRHCNFACPYCQLVADPAVPSKREIFVSTRDLISELQNLPKDAVIDYLTFCGNGEPTLAANLGEMIREIRKVRSEKIAIITNASMVNDPAAVADMKLADLVLFKIDAADEETFARVNRPAAGIKLQDIIKGIKAFKVAYKGKAALQIMFTGQNKDQAREIAAVARDLALDEVQLNTPLRPSPVKPLSEAQMREIKDCFAGLNVLSVYEEERKPYHPFDDKATEKRHGRYKEK